MKKETSEGANQTQHNMAWHRTAWHEGPACVLEQWWADGVGTQVVLVTPPPGSHIKGLPALKVAGGGGVTHGENTVQAPWGTAVTYLGPVSTDKASMSSHMNELHPQLLTVLSLTNVDQLTM